MLEGVWVTLCLGLSLLLPTATRPQAPVSQGATARDARAEQRATEAFRRAEFAKAAALLDKLIRRYDKSPSANPDEQERRVRELHVLALFNAGKRDAASVAYQRLIARAPEFRFNDEEVLPDTIAFFAALTPATGTAETAVDPTSAARPSPPAQDSSSGGGAPRAASTDAAPAGPNIDAAAALTPEPTASSPVAQAPIAVHHAPLTQEPEPRRWRWWYLAPLGVGQFLAGSPVRGTVFLVLQAGFAALNAVGYLAYYAPELQADGSSRDVARANLGVWLTNAAFVGLLGSVLAGVIDGAAFEP